MLDHLNDDCLCEIFRYLSVKEQLIVTTLNERFRDLIVENFWRKKYNKFTTTGDKSFDELNLLEFQKFYSYIAPHIQELTVHTTADVTFTSYLGRFTRRPDLDYYLHFTYPTLRVLRCYDKKFHNGHLLIVLRKCPNLEVLRLHSIYVTGEHLANFHNLRELYICSGKLEALHIDELLARRKILRMHLTGATTVTRDMDVVLQRVFPQIKEMRYYDDEEHIATANLFSASTHTLVNLEKLYCKYLKDFVYTLHTLRELYFESHLKVVDLFKLVENNTHLENLYMVTLYENFFANAREWLCGLTECLRRQRERKVALSMHVNMPQRVVQYVRQLVVDYDAAHGYRVPVLKIQKLSVNTSMLTLLINTSDIELAFKWS